MLMTIEQLIDRVSTTVALFTLISLISPSIAAQSIKHIALQRIDMQNGTADNMINTMLKSKNGYLWFGTQTGLNRYDGYEVIVYMPVPDLEESLAGSTVYSLAQDKNGYIWIATNNGLNKYDPITDRFVTFRHDPQDPFSLASNNLFKVFIDSKNQLWVATSRHGLSRYDAKTKHFTHYRYDADNEASLSSDKIRGIVEDEQGNLWVGTNKNYDQPHLTGLNRLNLATNNIVRMTKLTHSNATFSRIDTLYKSSKNKIWISTYAQGVFILDPIKQQIKPFTLGPFNEPFRVHSFADNQHNGMWIGSQNKGLYWFDENNNKVMSFNQSLDTAYQLNKQNIISMISDKNLLWLGTTKVGVLKLNMDSLSFKWLVHQQDEKRSLPKKVNLVDAAYDQSGNLWLAAFRDGLLRQNSIDKKVDSITDFANAYEDFHQAIVQSVLVDHKQILWVGTQKKGIFKIDLKANKLTSFTSHHLQTKTGNNASIRSMLEYPRGTIWLALNHTGLVKLEVKTGQFESVDFSILNDEKLAEVNFTLNSLFLDNQNTMWVGTQNAGAINIHPDSLKITHYQHTSGINSISNNYVSDFAQDMLGQIWISSDGGLDKLTWIDNRPHFESFNSKTHNLKNNTISSLQFDTKGHLWLSSIEHLVKFDPSNENFTYYGYFNGSKPGIYFDGFSLKTNDNRLIFGGAEGLSLFNPANISHQKSSFDVILNQFFLNNRVVPITSDKSSLLLQNINETAYLTLDYMHINFGFSFSISHFEASNNVKYQYRMLGFDENWINTDSRNRRATFTNLNAGQYEFQVRASHGEAWSDPKVLSLFIAPAPWYSWWAYTLYVLVILLIVGSLLFQRIKIHQALRLHAKAIEQRNEQLILTSKLFENTSEGVWVLDRALIFLAINDSFQTITGYSESEIIGKKIQFPTVKNQPKSFRDDIFQRVSSTTRWSQEMWGVRSNGEIYPISMVIDKILIKDSEDRVIDHNFVGIFSDITERKRAEEDLRQLAQFDSLTGLANRTQFQTLVQATIDQASNQRFVLLSIDLDNFKNINDSIGHSPGDQLLISMADKLKAFIKPPITLARLGGDEFALLIPHQAISYDTSQFAADFVSELLNVIRHDIELQGYHFQVTASIGGVLYPQDGVAYEELLRNADMAMYNAKNSGRDNCQFYSQAMNENARLRLDYESELSRAIERKELMPFFQPKASLHTGEICGVEVLARWHSNKFGWVRPDIFIALAEETGHISQISAYLLREALWVVLPHIKQGIFKGRLAFNLSAAQFKDDDFLDKIDLIIAQTSFPTDHLELEVTESLMMTDVPRAITLMHSLHQRGIELALDDFGTGYSSLSYLKRFPLDVLKIDRSFIIDIVHSTEDRNMVESIIQLSHNLNMKVVAEGAEDEDQMKLLTTMGCDILQGYYFSKPLPAKEYVTFLVNNVNIHSLPNDSAT